MLGIVVLRSLWLLVPHNNTRPPEKDSTGWKCGSVGFQAALNLGDTGFLGHANCSVEGEKKFKA